MKRDQLFAFIIAEGYVNPANIHQEEKVLSRLLQESEQFKGFYQNERPKIKKELFWYLNPLLTSNIITQPIFSEKNIILGYVVNIKSPILDTSESVPAIYELIHIILSEQGLTGLIGLTPEAAAIPEYVSFLQGTASALQNMLIGPLTNAILARNGFDIKGHYDSVNVIQRQQLELVTVEPQHPLEKLYQVSFYIQKALDWEIACNGSPGETDDFLSWYEARYPVISAEAKEVLEWVKKTGYTSISKVRKIFKEIIKRYEAEIYFVVK